MLDFVDIRGDGMAVVGQLVAGRYRVIRPLAAGGMSRVWLAADEGRGDTDPGGDRVVVKQCAMPAGLSRAEQDLVREWTVREARAFARVEDLHVVRILDVVPDPDQPWIVMEYVPSRSLQQLVNDSGPLSPARAAAIGLAVLEGLTAAGRAGLLHLDVKPGNVLIADDGRVVLSDFGPVVSEPGIAALTGAGIVLGSPNYIAPERLFDGVSTARSDLWSLGATLYHAVEGRPPFRRATTDDTLWAIAGRTPDPPRRAGPLADVLTGLLRRDPAERLSAAEVAERLRGVVAEPRASRAYAAPVSRSAPVPARAVAHVSTPVAVPVPAPRRARAAAAQVPAMAVVPVPAPGGAARAAVVPVPWSGAARAAVVPVPASGTAGAAVVPFLASGRARTAAVPVPASGRARAAAVPVPASGPARAAAVPVPASGPARAAAGSSAEIERRADQSLEIASGRPGRRRPVLPRRAAAVAAIVAIATVLAVVAAGNRRDDQVEAWPAGMAAQARQAAPGQIPFVLPAGFAWRNDPAGFRVAVPHGWRRAGDGGDGLLITAPGGRPSMRISAWTPPPRSVVAGLIEAERDVRLTAYRRIRIAATAEPPGVVWEYTYRDAKAGPMRGLEWVTTASGQTYRVEWRAPRTAWAAGLPTQAVVLESFGPVPGA